jgi:hypothetical protein
MYYSPLWHIRQRECKTERDRELLCDKTLAEAKTKRVPGFSLPAVSE